MSGVSPFAGRSKLTRRSPTEEEKRQSALIHEARTRSQTRRITSSSSTPPTSPHFPINQDNPTEVKPEVRKKEIKNIQAKPTLTVPKPNPVVPQTKQTETGIVNNKTLNKQTQIPTENLHTKMNQEHIESRLAKLIPEFSGAESPNRTNELMRFLGMADDFLASLTTEPEKNTFNRFIKYRLTGEAYTRMIHRQVKDYAEMKVMLMDMYSKTLSLEELEKIFTETKQTYGETIRNYGHRLMEALNRYKDGYRKKYGLRELDENYSKHLNENAVHVFKRGLNNIILRDKMLTHKAKDIEEMIKETEAVEKMLTITEIPQPQLPTNNQIPTYSQQENQPKSQQIMNSVTCNYCQTPGHTWRMCRMRMRDQEPRPAIGQNQQVTYIPYKQQQFRPSLPQQRNSFNNYRQTQQPYYSNHLQNQQPTYSNYRQAPQPNYSNFRQPPTAKYGNTKYCSFCKTTKGHTFDECRNKFKQPSNPNNFVGPPNYNTEPPQPSNNNSNNSSTNDLEKLFQNLKINQIFPQPCGSCTVHNTQSHNQNQGNEMGSNQS